MTKSERDKLIDELEREPEKPIAFKQTLHCPICNELHEVNYSYKGSPLLECPKADPNKIYFTNIEDPHWTFSEDPETKAGWGIFNFNWLMRPFRDAVLWHDKVTTKGSTAQKAGIPNWRINRAWRDMLDGMYRTQKGSGIIKRTAWLAGFFVAKVNRFFYEGSIKGKEKVTQDKDSGEMF